MRSICTSAVDSIYSVISRRKTRKMFSVHGQWFIGVRFNSCHLLFHFRDKLSLRSFSSAAVWIDTRKWVLTTLFRCLLRFITIWTNLRWKSLFTILTCLPGTKNFRGTVSIENSKRNLWLWVIYNRWWNSMFIEIVVF